MTAASGKGLSVGVVLERAAGEQRVALAPDGVPKLLAAGLTVLVAAGAGERAWFTDQAYRDAGATVVAPDEVFAGADVLLSLGRQPVESLRAGQTLIGLLTPLLDPATMLHYAKAGVTTISLDGLPRTLSRAQTMDALSSQANVAGYKAAVLAADTYQRFFPLLITAAGTTKPAEVLVLGAGVAGLQAIGTARRLGAIVRAYDVRPASRDEVQSLGAKFLELTSVSSAAGEGGYARALTAEEQDAQQAELAAHIAKQDVVITTAQVPGRRPPVLVTAAAVAAMRPGSVVIDMGASALGGNVEGSVPGETVVTSNGVVLVGAENLAATVPASASSAYSRNISALLLHFIQDASLAIDLDDEIAQGVVITHGGEVVHPATAAQLEGES